jgi:hypothetical protein
VDTTLATVQTDGPPTVAVATPKKAPRPCDEAYRQHLVLAEQKSQENYDKLVISLSCGGLGISFAFLDKFLKGKPPTPTLWLLAGAWACWAVSVSLVLVSYYLSRVALHKAIEQTDYGEIRSVRPGGRASACLVVCNIGSGFLFLVGVILMTWFIGVNLGV